jgi:hypothetical protein
MGAPWPAEKAAHAAKKDVFDLKERAKHWALQPLMNAQVPPIRDHSWPRSPIDNFIIVKLREAGLAPVAPADKRTLIRRVTFDLTGLPPTTAEIDAFLADESPNAFAKVVDRLLASPHYGERWGRHWLDLVRYAETAGHEFDFEMPLAYHYRDYIIRAFNLDLPYDQLVREHIAGDLLPNPRRHPEKGFNESIIGSGFFYLGEAVHSPVDIREDEAARIDNQIDVLSKTFQALTVSCARCHDHKFDAITTKDYYALVGYMQSTRYQEAFVDAEEKIGKYVRELSELQARATPSTIDVEELAGKLTDKEKRDISHPLHPWVVLGSAKSESDFVQLRQKLVAKMKEAIQKDSRHASESQVFDSFAGSHYDNWFVSGHAFGESPAGGVANSGQFSRKLQGALRSRTFNISHDKIAYRIRGTGATVNLIIDGYQRIKAPIYGGLTFKASGKRFDWHIQDVAPWKGHKAYIEILDHGDEEAALDEVRFCNSNPPDAPDPAIVKLVDDAATTSPAELALRYTASPPTELQSRTLPPASLKEYKRIELEIPPAMRVIAAADGTGVNERVFIRGNYRTPGDEVHRRFLEAIAGSDQPPPREGSGRLALAERVLSSRNPLLPRVMVNRIWQHHFGEGIVRSVDDFGIMGQTPTHPELLDFLAQEFIKSGWSIKAMHRMMLLSSTYQMSSTPSAEASKIDPQNKLLSHMPIRRLEAEAIRDSLLAISGRLDRTMFGPSILPHLTPFMSGRGRPAASGPLDGNGRRTIYLNVRRNFLSPMLLNFDYPIPATTMGKRAVSNVPAQALTMLNNPFVLQQANLWAKRILAEPNLTTEQRIHNLYLTAFARAPQPDELESALQFIKTHSNPNQAWPDLCHVLFNVKEFIFVN